MVYSCTETKQDWRGGEGHVISTSQWNLFIELEEARYDVAFWFENLILLSNYSSTFHKVWSSIGSPTKLIFFEIGFSLSHMAKASSLADSLGKELECAVCLEQYKEPKVLPCLHSFCKKCLEGLLPRDHDHGLLLLPMQTKEKRTRGRRRKRGVPLRSEVVREINCPSCRKSVEVS